MNVLLLGYRDWATTALEEIACHANKIRSLTNPYPNAYIEDTNGKKLFFSAVRLEDE